MYLTIIKLYVLFILCGLCLNLFDLSPQSALAGNSDFVLKETDKKNTLTQNNSTNIENIQLNLKDNTSMDSLTPNQELLRLANGLSILLIPDNRFPLIALRLYVHAGSAYENSKQAGLSHYFEHMVFKKNKNSPNSSVTDDIERLGGYLNAGTGHDYTAYQVDLPAQFLNAGLSAIKDMAFNALLDPEEMKSEKEVVLSELIGDEDKPGSRIFHIIQKNTLKNTVYEHPIIGFKETVSSFEKKDILEYVQRLYQPQNMLLVVCGNFNKEAAVSEIEKLFASLKNDKTLTEPEKINPLTLQSSPEIIIEARPLNKVYLAIALPVSHVGSSEEVGLDVLASLLGQGRTSHYYKKFKHNLELVDSISTAFYAFERIGIIYISAILDPNKLEPFWEEFIKDFTQLTSGTFTTQEIARAKLNIEDDFYRSKQTLGGIAGQEGYAYFLAGGSQAISSYLSSLATLQSQDIQNLLTKYFDLSRLTLAALVPEKTKLADLKAKLQAEFKAENIQQEKQPADSIKNTDNNEKSKTQALRFEPEIIDLGEGRTLVLLQDNTLPYIAVDMVLSGGNALLTEDEQGLASLAASTLTRGTKNKNGQDIDIFKEDRALSLSAGANKQSFSVSASFPARFSSDALTLLTEILTEPSFETTEMEKEKKNQIAAIKAGEDQPIGLAMRHLFPFLFKNHSYAYFNLGEPERISNFTGTELTNFWQKQIQQPWTLAVCGQFDKQEIIEAAKKLPVPSKKAIEISEPAWGEQHELILNLPDRNQAHLLLIFKTAPTLSKDQARLTVLHEILNGMSGLLFTKLRDKQGLAYTVEAIDWSTNQAGFLAFYIGTPTDKAEQALTGFKTVIQELKTELVPQKEIDRALSQMEGDYHRKRQSLSARSSEAASLLSNNYPLSFNIDLIKTSKQVTPQEIKDIVNKYLNINEAYILKVLPKP